MELPHYLVMLLESERSLAAAFRAMARGHAADADVAYTCLAFARTAEAHADDLGTITHDRYPRVTAEPERLRPPGFEATRSGSLGLLRDLAELIQLATFVQTTWELVEMAGYGARDVELLELASRCDGEVSRQLAWARGRMKEEAAQALVAA